MTRKEDLAHMGLKLGDRIRIYYTDLKSGMEIPYEKSTTSLMDLENAVGFSGKVGGATLFYAKKVLGRDYIDKRDELWWKLDKIVLPDGTELDVGRISSIWAGYRNIEPSAGGIGKITA